MTEALDRRTFVGALITPSVTGLVRRGGAQSSSGSEIAPPGPDVLRDLPRMMEIAGVPGIAMSVVKDRRVVWEHLDGVMEAGGQKVGPDTRWPAASLGKPVFALAVLRLADDGKLNLDTPLKQYVSDHAPADPRGDRITARHVLSHSSGLRNWRGRPDQPLVPDFEPGARFQYSGEGFYYLQRAVEHITGLGFEQFMDERLFGPLGMKSSTYSWRADVAARLVTGHDRGQPIQSPTKDFAARLLHYADQKGKPLASFTHEDIVVAMQSVQGAPAALPNNIIPNAAASLLTTPADYGAFVIDVMTGGNAATSLKPSTHRSMLTSQTGLNSALSWGLGWGLEPAPAGAGEPAFLWHWGDNGNWKNFVLAHAPSRSAIVIFTNGSRGLNLARRITSAAAGREIAAFLWL